MFVGAAVTIALWGGGGAVHPPSKIYENPLNNKQFPIKNKNIQKFKHTYFYKTPLSLKVMKGFNFDNKRLQLFVNISTCR